MTDSMPCPQVASWGYPEPVGILTGSALGLPSARWCQRTPQQEDDSSSPNHALDLQLQ